MIIITTIDSIVIEPKNKQALITPLCRSGFIVQCCPQNTIVNMHLTMA